MCQAAPQKTSKPEVEPASSPQSIKSVTSVDPVFDAFGSVAHISGFGALAVASPVGRATTLVPVNAGAALREAEALPGVETRLALGLLSFAPAPRTIAPRAARTSARESSPPGTGHAVGACGASEGATHRAEPSPRGRGRASSPPPRAAPRSAAQRSAEARRRCLRA